MARSGMVNIDDITDTKNKPMVEVKPFTNDHRPLADLVREAPVKVKSRESFVRDAKEYSLNSLVCRRGNVRECGSRSSKPGVQPQEVWIF